MANYDDLTKVLKERIENWKGQASSGSSGFVVQVGDSVATVYGLNDAVYGELVEFASGAQGIVFNLEEENAGCVILTGEDLVKDGEEVKRTGKVVSIPSGNAFFGRVVNPLGEALDGKGPVTADAFMPMEAPAAPVIDRGSVDTPLQTGCISIDAMIPIGRGQRELIIGDRQTGKTAIAIDTIINQKGKMLFVYTALSGRRRLR